jgi:hypothetical protein
VKHKKKSNNKNKKSGKMYFNVKITHTFPKCLPCSFEFFSDVDTNFDYKYKSTIDTVNQEERHYTA